MIIFVMIILSAFPIKVLVDGAMCKKSTLQIYCMEEKNEIHQNQ